MTTTTFDRLAYVDRLKLGGVDEPTARVHADALDQAMRDGVATHADIAGLKSDIVAVKSDLTVLTGEVLLHRWVFGVIVLLQLASLAALVSLTVKLVK